MAPPTAVLPVNTNEEKKALIQEVLEVYSGIQNYENTEILAGQGFQPSCLSLTGTVTAISR